MLSGPKVQLAFRLDEQGLVTLEKADVVYEEEIEYEVEEEVEDSDGEEEVEDSDGEKEVEDSDGEEEVEDNDGEEEDDQIKEGDEEDVKEGEDVKEDNETEKKDDGTEKKKKKKKTITVKKTKIKKHRNKLEVKSVNAIEQPENMIDHLSKEGLTHSRNLVKNLDNQDNFRREHGATMNGLESFVYASREFVRERCDEVTTEETRESILAELMEIEDWLFEVDLSTPIEDIKTKHDDMEKKIVTIRRKVDEIKARPLAVKSLRQVRSIVH